jgi:hypothetical protein
VLLTRRRAYYLLRELECVSCRSKKGTRLFIDGIRYQGEDRVLDDDSVLDSLCINCSHKAKGYNQSPRRKQHVDDAWEVMLLREKAKMPTRYDAYRTKARQPLTLTEVYEVMKQIPCAVCGRKEDEATCVIGFNTWSEKQTAEIKADTDPLTVIDVYRDLVWLCPDHYDQHETIRLSFDFDENFYAAMRTLYS